MFQLFASGIATLFFVSSLSLLNYGRRLGLRYMKKRVLAACRAFLPSRAPSSP